MERGKSVTPDDSCRLLPPLNSYFKHLIEVYNQMLQYFSFMVLVSNGPFVYSLSHKYKVNCYFMLY